MDDERQPYMGGHQKRRPGMRPQEAEVDAETRMASVRAFLLASLYWYWDLIHIQFRSSTK